MVFLRNICINSQHQGDNDDYNNNNNNDDYDDNNNNNNKGNTKNSHIGHCTHALANANKKCKTHITCEILSHVAQTVNTEQLQHSIL
jgi:hypothetical protein